ncbi:MAG TPA: S9 family peptidase [Flavipsychrobacter sp.]|nr:S9 family peptidase [Flavipsychrobacter sp.]
MKRLIIPFLLFATISGWAQEHMTPELLWSLKRVSADGISNDGKQLFYSARQYDIKTEKSTLHHYTLGIADGRKYEWSTPGGKNIIQRDREAWYAIDDKTLYRSTNNGGTWEAVYNGLENADNVKVSPNGKYVAFSKDVLVKPMLGSDIYPDLPKTTAKVYTDLDYRHWDTWEDGKFSHIFIASIKKNGTATDIMPTEPYDCPQKPDGGPEDLVWAPDSKGLIYVCKKRFGKEYALSTNTDLYYYDLKSGNTVNWTVGMMGYDTQPEFSHDGKRIAWTGMAHDGYESDKNDLYVMDLGNPTVWKINVTDDWDGTVESFKWSNNGNKIFFTAPWRGTVQLFEVNIPAKLVSKKSKLEIRQVTDGKFDVTGIVGDAGNELVVSRTDMNHASELFAVNTSNGDMRALTHENDGVYSSIKLSKTVMKYVTTTDGKKMGVWVIYPPDFDSTKKYPTLLYCQGGPQSALSQFYSFRWNFQLMAAQGYIVVAPNRRGMPGWGVKWNEEISKDWGGQPMQDYLSAIDDMSNESYVDKNRLGCVGASYGGYSVYMLAGIHNNRFKTFIAHDGLFDLKSWYGTTEEMWFPNWDIGGAYWENPQPKSYEKFNPSNYVDKWNTPIMIVQGGIDYRVPVEQGLEAFQAAQLRGIKSKLLYLPNENHWVLHAQNAIAWQREFFKWLEETLK